MGHDNRVSGNIDGVRAAFQLDRDIGPKAEGAGRHSLEVHTVVTGGKLVVAARFEPEFDGGELAFLLRVANDRIGDGPAETIRDDGRGAVDLLSLGGCFLPSQTKISGSAIFSMILAIFAR